MTEALREELPEARPGGTGLATFALVLTGVIQLLLVAVLTRTLSKTEFAALSLIVLASTTISAVAPLGVPTALTVFLPRRDPAQARALGWWSSIILFLLALPWALGLLLVAPRLGGSNPELVYCFRLLGLFLLADLPSQALPAYLLARHRHAGYFLTTIGFAITRFASLAVPALLGAGLSLILELFLAVALLRLLWCVSVFLFVERGRLSREGTSGRELIRFGLPVSLSFVVNKLNVQVDKYLVALVAGAEAFAVYTVGAQEIPLVSSLAYSATSALIPTLALAHHRNDRDSFIATWHRSAANVGLIMMPAFWYFLLFAEPAIRVLFTSAFAEAAIPFRVYLLLLPLRVCAYSGILRALGESRPVLTASLAALALNAALVVPLYHVAGIAGPALAAVASQLMAAVILLRVIRQRLALDWWGALPYGRLGRSFLAAGAAAVPAAFTFYIPNDGWRLVIGAIVLLAGYLSLGRWSGVIAPEQLAELRDLLALRGLRRGASAGAGRV